MSPSVFIPSLNGLDLPPFDLASFLYPLWQMSMPLYPPDLGHVLVPLYQRRVIFQLLPLPCRLHARTL
jgi:hypothetical protein